MAFVNVPRDLDRVKSRLVLNLTVRQLICFGTAAIAGIPVYIFTRGMVGNSAGALLMITIMFPFFFLGIYEKDGMPAEKLLRNYIRVRFVWPGKRPYKTLNLYEVLAKEEKSIATQNQTTAKAVVGQCPAGKSQPR